MKKYRTKPWAKGLACGLFVLAMTVSVICLGNVRWLAYHGAYQWEGTRQLVEEEEAVWVENLTNQLADGYRSYRDGDQSLENLRAKYTAEEIVGRLAFAYGLQPEPAPRTPESLIPDFSWDKVPKQDICLPEGLF